MPIRRKKAVRKYMRGTGARKKGGYSQPMRGSKGRKSIFLSRGKNVKGTPSAPPTSKSPVTKFFAKYSK